MRRDLREFLLVILSSSGPVSAVSVSASLLCLRLVTRLRSTLLFSFPPAAGGAGQLPGVGGVWGGVADIH